MLINIVLVVVLPTALVIVASIFLARRGEVSSGDFDSDSLSFAGGVVSALFTVVLAFYIVFAWQLGADIETAADAEADALIDAYHQAALLPPEERSESQGLVRDYAARVADVEWPQLSEGNTDPGTSDLLNDLRARFAALPVDGGVLEAAREQGLRDVRMVDENHRSRVSLSTSDQPFVDVLLFASLIGAALTVAIPLLVGLSARPANIVVMGVLTFVVGATAALSIQLAHPLEDPFGVDPGAFHDVLFEIRRAS